MSASELRERAEELMKQAEQLATREFESTLNFLSDKLTLMGKTKKDAVIHLVKMMKTAEAEQTLAELVHSGGYVTADRPRQRTDLDSAGIPPAVGVVYRLPTGETWVRQGTSGATKKSFAAHAKSTTWASMEA